jgi:hypothetical protein
LDLLAGDFGIEVGAADHSLKAALSDFKGMLAAVR